MSAEFLRPTNPEREIPGILRIGVDLDGVVVNFEDSACEAIKQKLGYDPRTKRGPTEYHIDQWSEIQAISGGPEFVRSLWGNPEVYQNAKPIPGAIRTLNKWRTQGHQVWIPTARYSPAVREVTIQWLESHDLNWLISQVIFRPSGEIKRVDFKPQAAKDLKLHAFIEDHAPTLAVMMTDSLMVKILKSYSWNWLVDAGSQAVRLNNWRQIDEIIQEASRWHYYVAQY